MYFVYVCETICPCCKNMSPKKYGLTKCTNLRVVKHRIVNDSKTDLFIRENPKIYIVKRLSHDLPYEDAFTLLQSYISE